MNKVLGVFSEGDPSLPLIKTVLDKLGVELSVMPAPSPLNEVLTQANLSGAVLLGASAGSEDVRDALAEGLKLHTSYRSGMHMRLVTNAESSLYGKRSGFDSDARFGRSAYDTEYIGELEIERTARVAYELAQETDSALLLVDRANKMLTSKLWRKIVSDINEDYPSVHLDMRDISELFGAPLNYSHVYLSPKPHGDVLWSLFDIYGFEALIGDCPLALYTPVEYPMDLIFALPHMLKHCFALDKQSAALADCLKPLSLLSSHALIEDTLAAFDPEDKA